MILIPLTNLNKGEKAKIIQVLDEVLEKSLMSKDIKLKDEIIVNKIEEKSKNIHIKIKEKQIKMLFKEAQCILVEKIH